MRDEGFEAELSALRAAVHTLTVDVAELRRALVTEAARAPAMVPTGPVAPGRSFRSSCDPVPSEADEQAAFLQEASNCRLVANRCSGRVHAVFFEDTAL